MRKIVLFAFSLCFTPRHLALVRLDDFVGEVAVATLNT